MRALHAAQQQQRSTHSAPPAGGGGGVSTTLVPFPGPGALHVYSSGPLHQGGASSTSLPLAASASSGALHRPDTVELDDPAAEAALRRAGPRPPSHLPLSSALAVAPLKPADEKTARVALEPRQSETHGGNAAPYPTLVYQFQVSSATSAIVPVHVCAGSASWYFAAFRLGTSPCPTAAPPAVKLMHCVNYAMNLEFVPSHFRRRTQCWWWARSCSACYPPAPPLTVLFHVIK